jgi:hypothetical protein
MSAKTKCLSTLEFKDLCSDRPAMRMLVSSQSRPTPMTLSVKRRKMLVRSGVLTSFVSTTSQLLQ